MYYCPFCAEPLNKPYKVCPYCKKVIDINYYQAVYDNPRENKPNRSAQRRIWYKEHAHIIFPVLTLFLGIIIGGILLYGYGQLQFSSEREQARQEISQLKTRLAQKDKAMGNVQDTLKKEIHLRDQQIKLLLGQQKYLKQIIAFTRRLANQSQITVTSPAQSDYFSRNVRYLIKQFEKGNEQLKALGMESKPYDLNTIPQLMGE